MDLGSFSLSLSVKDLKISRDFYFKLGFLEIGGDINENWLILKNGAHVIGLFQGMFDQNMMTFNPGWDQNGNQASSFMDVRDIQKALKDSGITLMAEADENTQGPASIMFCDPDGNAILVDQHR
jgi:predicted lactoylglutathione lyase